MRFFIIFPMRTRFQSRALSPSHKGTTLVFPSFYLRNLNDVVTHFNEILFISSSMPSNKTPINQNYQLYRCSFLTLYFHSFTTQ